MFWHKNELKRSKLKYNNFKFDYDKNQVNPIEIQEQKFMFCQKCDKILELKEILLTKGFDMKDFLSVRFCDTSLKEIAKMVNY